MDLPGSRLLDEIATAATVAPIEADIDGWVCKAAPDLPFRRCNTVLPPVGAAADTQAFERSLARVRRWYADLGLRLIVQVSSADPHHRALDALLADHALDVEAPVDLMVAALGRLVAPAAGDRPGVATGVTAGVDRGWAAAYGRIHGGDPITQERTEAYGRMLEHLGDRALGAACTIDGQVVGVGFGVVDRGVVGVFGMGTAPDRRRLGVASTILRALASAAADHGAAHAYLQVEPDNAPAVALYCGMGFERSHGYHYRSEPAGAPIGC